MLVVNQYKQNLLDNYYLDSNQQIRYKNDGYLGRYKKDDLAKTFKMHRLGYLGVHVPKARATVPVAHLILLLNGIQIPNGTVVDHIDGNYLNNQLNNLRVVTQQLNTKNTDKPAGRSGEKHIDITTSGAYRVRIRLNGKRITLGSFKTIQEAVQERDKYLALRLQQGYTLRHCK